MLAYKALTVLRFNGSSRQTAKNKRIETLNLLQIKYSALCILPGHSNNRARLYYRCSSNSSVREILPQDSIVIQDLHEVKSPHHTHLKLLKNRRRHSYSSSNELHDSIRNAIRIHSRGRNRLECVRVIRIVQFPDGED